MDLKSVYILLALVATVAADGHTGFRCSLRNINVFTDLQESELAGTWYEARWWYAQRAEYENYAYQITPVPAGIRVRVNIRQPPRSPCKINDDATRPRIGRAQYEYYNRKYRRTVLSYILYVDDTILVEYVCLDRSGDTCRLSEVALFTRTPCERGQRCLDDNLIGQLVTSANVVGCLDTTRFRNTPQIRPFCAPFTGPVRKPGPNGHGKTLVEIQKARDIAATEKFVVEKAKLSAETELIGLQIQQLRRGYHQGK